MLDYKGMAGAIREKHSQGGSRCTGRKFRINPGNERRKWPAPWGKGLPTDGSGFSGIGLALSEAQPL